MVCSRKKKANSTLESNTFPGRRYITGTCPFAPTNAYGDQCEMQEQPVARATHQPTQRPGDAVPVKRKQNTGISRCRTTNPGWNGSSTGIKNGRTMFTGSARLARQRPAIPRHDPRQQLGHQRAPARCGRKSIVCVVRCADRLYLRHES